VCDYTHMNTGDAAIKIASHSLHWHALLAASFDPEVHHKEAVLQAWLASHIGRHTVSKCVHCKDSVSPRMVMNLKYAGMPGCASAYSFRLLKHHQKCLMNVGIAMGRLQVNACMKSDVF
jgi:phage terminase large subunit GpA-like protein